jgi:hypothetical protein
MLVQLPENKDPADMEWNQLNPLILERRARALRLPHGWRTDARTIILR